MFDKFLLMFADHQHDAAPPGVVCAPDTRVDLHRAVRVAVRVDSADVCRVVSRHPHSRPLYRHLPPAACVSVQHALASPSSRGTRLDPVYLYNLPRFFERNIVAVTDPVTNVTSMRVYKSALRQNVANIVVYKTILFFVVRFFAPLTALALLNLKLINAIRRSHQLQNKQSQRADGSRWTRTSIEHYSSMLVIVVLVFLLCEIPDFVLRIWLSLHIFFPGRFPSWCFGRSKSSASLPSWGGHSGRYWCTCSPVETTVAVVVCAVRAAV